MATLGESWNQAAGATGVDQAGSSTGYYILALSILTLEVIWWVGIGFFIKRGFGIKRTEKAEDQLSP